MTNSVDPDQTAPIGAVWSGSILFAFKLKLVINVRQLFAADDFSRRHFSDAFFLSALRVNDVFVKYFKDLQRITGSSAPLRMYKELLLNHFKDVKGLLINPFRVVLRIT